MRSLKNRSLCLGIAGLLTVASGARALADDSEIFLGTAAANGVPPNILLVLDTSGSMGSTVLSRAAYDPTTTYAAGKSSDCSTSSYYYVDSSGSTPTGCSDRDVGTLPTSLMKCAALVAALGSSGSGVYGPDLFVRLHKSRLSGKYSWAAGVGNLSSDLVECKGDDGLDGNLDATATHPYGGNDATTAKDSWNTSTSNNYWVNGGTGTGYQFYSANYMNYLQYTPATNEGTRLSVVQDAATTLINGLPSSVNVGLMRYSKDASGGMVTYPVTPLTNATVRSDLITTLKGYSASGNTPLSETLFEAFRYYSGGDEYFGDKSSPSHSIDSSLVDKTGKTYQSPIKYSCQKNYIVYLTDGLPTSDNEANTEIGNLGTDAGSCDASGPTDTNGRCLGAMSQYMNKHDLSSLTGAQTVQSHFIGFGGDPELNSGFGYLKNAASKGGGQAYLADDLSALQQTLTTIFGNILSTASTFTAPTVSVNAFNRTQTLDDLYVTLFQPSTTYHWDGNLKKYKIAINAQGSPVIVDRANKTDSPAVDAATGQFKSTSRDLWQTTDIDGAIVTNGGAANVIPVWDASVSKHRNLYTYVGANPPANSPASLVSIETTSAALTNTAIGLSAAAPTATHDAVIDFARGEDLKDVNQNRKTEDDKHRIGDPMHSQPAVVVYGGTPSAHDITDAAIYTATNDGYLHSFDVTTGQELWAFIPQQLLTQLAALYNNNSSPNKHYSLDGDIRILKYDINGDGVVDAAEGDRVLLFVGQGRGGSNYFALDVTSKTAPKFLWSAGPSVLTDIAQAWSAPVLGRVNIDGATQNSQKFVLIFGGGYDPTEENPTYNTGSTIGNRLYMVDALFGTLLWSAGASSSSADLKLDRMDHSIPSGITVIDTDNDGLADRMYVGDMAAQLWRFDIFNGNKRDALVTGGVLASLGTRDDTVHTAAATRRFYNPPDVSVVRKVGVQPYMNIAIGSGYRGHPLNTGTQERFYAIKDTLPFTKIVQSAYTDAAVLHDGDSSLIDVTGSATPTMPAGSRGWKLLLDQPSDTWIGEKVLAQSNTLQNKIIFNTYIPSPATAADPCQPAAGTNRLYSVSVFNGAPVDKLHNGDNSTTEDRWVAMPGSGIAGGTAFMFLGSDVKNDCTGDKCDAPGQTGKGTFTCINGVSVLGVCRNFDTRLKTYWQQMGVN